MIRYRVIFKAKPIWAVGYYVQEKFLWFWITVGDTFGSARAAERYIKEAVENEKKENEPSIKIISEFDSAGKELGISWPDETIR